MARTKYTGAARKYQRSSNASPKKIATNSTSNTTTPGDVEMPRRNRLGTAASMEIDNDEIDNNDASLLIDQRLFKSLVHEIAKDNQIDLQFDSQAVMALQEAAEAYMTGVFKNARSCALHDNRVTVMVKDLRLARVLQRKRP